MNNSKTTCVPEAEFGNMLIVRVDSAISCLRRAQTSLKEMRATRSAISPFTSVCLTFEPLLVSAGDE